VCVFSDDFHLTLAELGFVAHPTRYDGPRDDADAALQAQVVRDVFQRMHCIDSAGHDGREDDVSPLTYHQFVRWAVPLDFRLYVRLCAMNGRVLLSSMRAHVCSCGCCTLLTLPSPHRLIHCWCMRVCVYSHTDNTLETRYRRRSVGKALSAVAAKTSCARSSGWIATATGKGARSLA
jgi:hypothetical protein